ncbi:winged helix-turn-helix domain-containing tetratricopeptide repeat protein [Bradyrhizobium sp. AZCC 1721]|uniref:winged helix-turn-helix domain-containing tetratricopeptide repeat protein n=1 Tax=Bradyrhizobium sp. AZCC 1721 TaxID=3117016 RepID=UPI002FF325DE
MRYLFDYTFDTERRELHRGADAVSITPQVFDLLDYLVRNRERVVSKDDLISAVWNGRIVSDAALTTRLNAARNAIGDSGEKQRLIKTLPRKGFRFIGTVQEVPGPTVASFAAKAENPPKPAVDLHENTSARGMVMGRSSTPRLSIVVLPFANLGGGPEQEYFADGITESLTTDLSRISGTFVIACNTAFTYKGKAVDVQQLGRELSVRYVLEGSVQRGGDRLRVNVQLIDAETRSHLWADRFDKPVTNLFEMQDEIVARLAIALHAQLIEAEARRAELSPHPDAVDLIFQGRSWLSKGMTPEHMAQARSYFERALELDPGNIEALVGTANLDVASVIDVLDVDRDARLAAAETALIRVLSRSPRHARAHMFLGAVQSHTNRAALAIGQCEQALTLDSNLADAHGVIGWAKLCSGRGAETEAHFQEAFRLSPRDSRAYRWMLNIGIAKQVLGADAEAVVWLRRCVEANWNYPIGHFSLAAALARVGSPDEAQASVRAGLALDPTFTLRRLRHLVPGGLAVSTDPTFRAGAKRVLDDMRLAGVPEG